MASAVLFTLASVAPMACWSLIFLTIVLPWSAILSNRLYASIIESCEFSKTLVMLSECFSAATERSICGIQTCGKSRVIGAGFRQFCS